MEEGRLYNEAMEMLKQTSRTFYIPITLLDPALKTTTASAYLCMRAIDEIEDHETLDEETKQMLLHTTSLYLKESPFPHDKYLELVRPFQDILPEVTQRLGDWLSMCPAGIAETMKQSTSEMAEGMAYWAKEQWNITTKSDLDDYTYYVAGLVGVMLSDIWEWYDGTQTDRALAIGYGRGLQAVNMLRNYNEDYERGVSFVPPSWTMNDMFVYAENNLVSAEQYITDISNTSMLMFCRIPLVLAQKTLAALKEGREKISRTEVEDAITQIKKVSSEQGH